MESSDSFFSSIRDKKLQNELNISRRLNTKEVLITQRDEEFVFPVADGSAKIIRKKLQIPRIHSETDIHCKYRESQRRS